MSVTLPAIQVEGFFTMCTCSNKETFQKMRRGYRFVVKNSTVFYSGFLEEPLPVSQGDLVYIKATLEFKTIGDRHYHNLGNIQCMQFGEIALDQLFRYQRAILCKAVS